MTKMEIIRFKALAKKLRNQAVKYENWNRKNGHRCGHSNTADSLGDEGWHKLWENYGTRSGLLMGAWEIDLLIKKLTKPKVKK